jgi:hypothetical protein
MLLKISSKISSLGVLYSQNDEACILPCSHEHSTLVETTTVDYLKQAASDMLSILQNPPSQLPYLAYGDATKNAIIQIATLLR